MRVCSEHVEDPCGEFLLKPLLQDPLWQAGLRSEAVPGAVHADIVQQMERGIISQPTKRATPPDRAMCPLPPSLEKKSVKRRLKER